MFKKFMSKINFHKNNDLSEEDRIKKINPTLVHNVAAEIFWSYAYNTGVREANNCALEGVFPERMLSYNIVKNIILKYVKEVPDFAVFDVFDAVKEEITSHSRNERNLLGAIYIEDIPNGRSLEFKDHEKLEELKNDADGFAPYRLNIFPNNKIETMGKLLIRTPLPAVVVSSKLPNGGAVFIQSTEQALGYHKTMILSLHSVHNLSSDCGYLLEGIFYIPIGNARSSDLWHKIIPNSVGFYKKTTFFAEDATKLEVSLDFG